MASAVLGFQADMESSQEELLEASQTPGLRTKVRHTAAFVAGLLAICAAISFWHHPSISAKAKTDSFIGLEEQWQTDCDGLPYLKLNELLSSNLGKQGPDVQQQEGLIYSASLLHVGANVTTAEVHIHSIKSFDVTELNNESHDNNYRPAWKTGEYVDGICGKFACINLKPGESVKLRAHVFDPKLQQDISIPHGVISFFDLDNGPNCIEHVTVVDGFKTYYLTNETEVNVTKDGRFTTFAGTREGTGLDNPTDPLELTFEQKDRAVTIEYEDAPYFDFEVGTSAGHTGRVFTFVFRPSLLCAKTKMPDGCLLPAMGPKAPIVVEAFNAAFKGLPLASFMITGVAIVIQSFM